MYPVSKQNCNLFQMPCNCRSCHAASATQPTHLKLFFLRLPVCLRVLVAEPPPPATGQFLPFFPFRPQSQCLTAAPSQCLPASAVFSCFLETAIFVSECSPHLRMRGIFFLLGLLLVAPLASAYWGLPHIPRHSFVHEI